MLDGGVTSRATNTCDIWVRGKGVGVRGFETMRKGNAEVEVSTLGAVRGKRISSNCSAV